MRREYFNRDEFMIKNAVAKRMAMFTLHTVVPQITSIHPNDPGQGATQRK